MALSRMVYHTVVAKVERKSRVLRGWKDKLGDAHFEHQDLGWFMSCAGSRESLYVGNEPTTSWKPGQPVRVIIEEVESSTEGG